MEPTLGSLREFLQLSPPDLKKVVLGRPTLLGFSWQDNMELKLMSLKEKLQLSPAELKELVLRKPNLLGLRWDTNMEPQIAMMEKAVGHAGAAAEVKALIFSDPGVLTYSNEKRVRPRLAELKAVSQGVDRQMLSAVCNDTDARWEKRMADIA
jgi:mTERF domain-containing protein